MRMTMNWGTGLALAYATFALATTGFVAFAMARTVDLVSPDYYAESLRQDARMEAERNAQALRPVPRLLSEPGAARVLLHAAQAQAVRGTIRFYRPSDSRADREVPLSLDARGEQRLPLDGLQPGQWVVQVRWTGSDRAYYFETPVFVR